MSITTGRWFNIENGQIVGESWGAPGFSNSDDIKIVKANGWYPSIVSGGDPTKDTLGYETVQQSIQIVGDIVQITMVTQAKDITSVQDVASEMVDSQQYDQLAPTDWYVTRKADIGTAIPADVAAARAAIRFAGTNAKNAVDAATTVDAVIAVFPINWSNTSS